MPECDGPTASIAIHELLREHRPEDPNVLICCVTAYTTEGYRLAALDSGMKRFLTKPINMNNIEELLHETGLK